MMTKVENPEDYDDPSTFQFGDLIENGWAGDGNPIKVGYFVERGFRKGRLNPGPWIRLTDKRGKFWETSAQRGHHRLKRLPAPTLTEE